jgi:hypothetical protein
VIGSTEGMCVWGIAPVAYLGRCPRHPARRSFAEPEGVPPTLTTQPADSAFAVG